MGWAWAGVVVVVGGRVVSTGPGCFRRLEEGGEGVLAAGGHTRSGGGWLDLEQPYIQYLKSVLISMLSPHSPPLLSPAYLLRVCSAVTALEAQQSALYGSSPVRLRPQRGFWSNALLN